MFTVKVIERSNGRPVQFEKVSVIFEGLFDCSRNQYTDSIGEAHFSEDNAGDVGIYIGGRSVYHGEIAGRIVIYI